MLLKIVKKFVKRGGKIIPIYKMPRNTDEQLPYLDRVFRTVAPRYNLMKALLSGGKETKWKSRLFCKLIKRAPQKCLDIATGTGDFLTLLMTAGCPDLIVAFDLNEEMLKVARRHNEHPIIKWVRGDLNNLSFANGTFDLITVGYGLRYTSEPQSFLQSCYNILTLNGCILSFDLGHPRIRWLRPVWFTFLFVTTSILGAILHANIATYWHLPQSLMRYPGQDRISEILQDVGFKRIQCVNILGGIMVAHFAQK